MLHWCDHPHGQSPLGYVAMLRYDTAMGIWPDVSGAFCGLIGVSAVIRRCP